MLQIFAIAIAIFGLSIKYVIMKTEVLKYLQSKEGTPEERYNAAMALLRKSEGKSIPAVNYYNRAGYTSENLKNICYDLQQLHGVTDREVLAVSSKKGSEKSKVNSLKPSTLEEVLKIIPENVKAILKFLAHMPSGDYPSEILDLWKPLPDFVAEHKNIFTDDLGLDLKEEDIFKTLYMSLEDWTDDNNEFDKLAVVVKEIAAKQIVDDSGTDVQKNGTDVPKNDTKDTKSVTQLIEEAPDNAKGGLSLRVQFPFLAQDDCPPNFKILVADMLTAWDTYKNCHEALNVVAEEGKEALSDAELFELAKEAVEAFELNHAIWDELNYYKEHGDVLGNHPIFADDQLKEKVAGMKGTELVKRRNNVRSYITKENKKLKPDTTEAAAKKINAKIKELNQELNLLDARLEEK